jgi:hypothetical protein
MALVVECKVSRGHWCHIYIWGWVGYTHFSRSVPQSKSGTRAASSCISSNALFTATIFLFLSFFFLYICLLFSSLSLHLSFTSFLSFFPSWCNSWPLCFVFGRNPVHFSSGLSPILFEVFVVFPGPRVAP